MEREREGGREGGEGERERERGREAGREAGMEINTGGGGWCPLTTGEEVSSLWVSQEGKEIV